MKKPVKALFQMEGKKKDESLRVNHNTRVMNINVNEMFIKCINMTIEESFIQYQHSDDFTLDCKALELKEGNQYLIVYNYYVSSFLSYYQPK